MLIKTLYKCVYKYDNIDMYVVKINRKSFSHEKTCDNIIEAAKYHDYFKTQWWGYKKSDKRLNFPIKEIIKPIIKSISKPKKRKLQINNSKNKRKRIYRKNIGIGKYQTLICCQNYCCNICDNKLGRDTEKDHILSIERYNNDDLKNIQVLCISCHKWKSGYIDNNKDFVLFVLNLQKQNLDEDLFYTKIINKIRYLHSLSTSMCSCKFNYIKDIKKHQSRKSCFTFIKNIFNIFK